MHLPPQAYTKETLIQAYNWLRSQPPHVQELAKSPDVLVALYSKAQMHGENYLSRTNLQGFKTELKNLASMMGEFDESQLGAKSSATAAVADRSPYTAASSATSSLTVPPSAPPSSQTSAFSVPQTQTPAGPLMPQMPIGAIATPPVPSIASLAPDPGLPLFNAMVNVPQGQDLRSVLDARSWTMIQEVKNHFNLSSETEAVRLLIAMGYQKMRSQF